MTIWHLKTDVYSGAGGGIFWSETTKSRQVSQAPRWYSTSGDICDSFGPYPEDLKAQVAKHWCLLSHPRDSLPDTFMSIKAFAFTGAPFGTDAVTACFEAHCPGGVERLRVPRLWSQPDEAKVDTPYFIANVFATARTLDLTKSAIRVIPKPRHGHPALLKTTRAQDMIVHPRAQGDLHVWRDAATGVFFCDDVFRAAIETAAPKAYEFCPTTPAD